jgi:hypothetical protein
VGLTADYAPVIMPMASQDAPVAPPRDFQMRIHLAVYCPAVSGRVSNTASSVTNILARNTMALMNLIRSSLTRINSAIWKKPNGLAWTLTKQNSTTFSLRLMI